MTNNLVARFTQTVWMSTAFPPHVAKEVKKNSVVEEKHSPLLNEVKEKNKQTWENVNYAHLQRSSQMEKMK